MLTRTARCGVIFRRQIRAGLLAVHRTTSTSTIPDDSIQFFQQQLGESGVLMSDIDKYNVDWQQHYHGSAQVVLRPRTTDDVVAILQHCNANEIGVVPLGGNTGLVGGGIAQSPRDVILSMEKMDKVDSFDEESSILTCEAGCILESAEKFLNEREFTMPLDLASKGSCVIGGNVATNAGGIRMVRYGNLHGKVVGLQVVLPDGRVIDTTTDTRKDNTGFHLKNLFIGSEGTLGVITKVAISAAPLPRHKQVAMLAVNDFDGVRELVRRAKAELGETVAALEYLDQIAFQASLDYLADVRGTTAADVSPFECNSDSSSHAAPPFVFLVEVAGANADHNSEKMEAFLAAAMEDGIVVDGVLNGSEREYQELWELRETSASALGYNVYRYSHDVSLPIGEFNKYVDAVRQGITSELPDRDDIVVCGFGHLGDGNLHITVQSSEYDKKVHASSDKFIYGLLEKLHSEGKSVSPSAEHGVGLQKRSKLKIVRDQDHVSLLRQLKAVFDPNGIMNPGKVL